MASSWDGGGEAEVEAILEGTVVEGVVIVDGAVCWSPLIGESLIPDNGCR